MTVHKNVPEIDAPDDARSMSLAVKEAKGFSAGNLEAEAAKAAHARGEHFRKHFHCAVIIGFWVFFVIVMYAGLSWAWHMLIPEKYHFLSAVEQGKLQNMLFGTLISGVLSVLTRNKYL